MTNNFFKFFLKKMWTQKNFSFIENRVFAAILNCLVIKFCIFLHFLLKLVLYMPPGSGLDPDPETQLNPDPIQTWIQNTGPGKIGNGTLQNVVVVHNIINVLR